jgi:hypothetical protein
VCCKKIGYPVLTKNRTGFGDGSTSVAIPLSESRVEWKSRSQCVWNDDAFSQIGLHLETKTAIQNVVEKYAPKLAVFFTDDLELPDAGICEMLDDLKLMQEQKRTDIERVHRLYRGIQSFSRNHSQEIKSVNLTK